MKVICMLLKSISSKPMMVTDFTRLKVIASLPDPEAASPHSPT
jgi:hypothetical protein